MTPQQRQHLTDLIHAAFERAQQQGSTPPIDLAPFGLLLRQLEPGFSHQSYGHEKLLYLLRNEFEDLLHIRKDAQSVPPRYAVSLRQGLQAGRRTTAPPQPRVAVTPPVIDTALVDNSLLEQFLQRLAATSATTDQRLNDMERQLRHMANELEHGRAQEARLQQELQTQKDAWQAALAKIEKISISIEQEKKQVQATVSDASSQRKPSRVPICVKHDGCPKFSWNSREGDFVKKDQIIAYTDMGWGAISKTVLPVHSPATGILTEVKQAQNSLLPDKKTVVGYIQPT